MGPASWVVEGVAWVLLFRTGVAVGGGFGADRGGGVGLFRFVRGGSPCGGQGTDPLPMSKVGKGLWHGCVSFSRARTGRGVSPVAVGAGHRPGGPPPEAGRRATRGGVGVGTKPLRKHCFGMNLRKMALQNRAKTAVF